jgi:hypothetical protein
MDIYSRWTRASFLNVLRRLKTPFIVELETAYAFRCQPICEEAALQSRAGRCGAPTDVFEFDTGPRKRVDRPPCGITQVGGCITIKTGSGRRRAKVDGELGRSVVRCVFVFSLPFVYIELDESI